MTGGRSSAALRAFASLAHRGGSARPRSDGALRVAFDARSLVSPAPRGWDRYLLALVAELPRLGVEATLFHRAREPLHAVHLRGLECRVVGLDDRGGVHWEQVAVPRALARGGFDLFHAPAERGVPFVSPCPVVLTIHSVTDRSYAELVRDGTLPGRVGDYTGRHPRRWNPGGMYHRLQLRWPRHVLAPSEFCRGEIIRFLGFPGDRVTVTHLAAPARFHAPPRPAAEREALLAELGITRPYLLFVGGYEPHKNIGGLLDVLVEARRRRPDLSLVCAGTHRLPAEIEAAARDRGLVPGRDTIFLLDVNDLLNDLYDGAEVFVTMSWRETFCLPALEAMMRGAPVVASRWGAAPEIVGDAGRLVDPRDAGAAADAVLELMASPDRAAWAANARQRAARFSWEATAARTLEVYRAALRDGARPS